MEWLYRLLDSALRSAASGRHPEDEPRSGRSGNNARISTPLPKREDETSRPAKEYIRSRKSSDQTSVAPNSRAETGRRGEELAAAWLRHAGYEICDRNWRSGRYELDIVARRFDELHFVEVKTRRADGLTSPEEALTPAKQRAFVRAAAAYLAAHGSDAEPRFDLVAVEMRPDGEAEVRFVADAVESHW